MTTPLTFLAAVLAALALASLAAGGKALLGGDGQPPTHEARGRVVEHAPLQKEFTVGGRSATRKTTAMTRVHVAYDVAGERRALLLDRAPELAARDFPVGKELPVFYDPAGQGEPRLERGHALPMSTLLLFAGTLLLLASSALFFFARRA